MQIISTFKSVAWMLHLQLNTQLLATFLKSNKIHNFSMKMTRTKSVYTSLSFRRTKTKSSLSLLNIFY